MYTGYRICVQFVKATNENVNTAINMEHIIKNTTHDVTIFFVTGNLNKHKNINNSNGKYKRKNILGPGAKTFIGFMDTWTHVFILSYPYKF